MFFGRRLRSALPALLSQPASLAAAAATREKASSKIKQNYDAHSRELAPLSIGDRVQVHGGDSATVLEQNQNGFSYKIQFDNGATTSRYRRFLHRLPDNASDPDGVEC